MKEVGYVLYGLYVLTILWLLITSLVQLHLLWHSRKRKKGEINFVPSELPFISIQVPVYNEKYVIEGLLQSLAQFDYPKDLYEIQILDDSTDETSFIIDQQVTQLEKEALAISVLRRGSRQGFKAGALQYGLPFCKGDLIAIFDADFRPPKDFLKTLLPHFKEDKVGLVQARWGHLNKEQNFLTRIQTFLLDTYFSVEQAGRHNAGYFTNFCGTAGIWRKQCIVDAGNWDGSVLSEDLDLSYRAQLKGWQMVYEPNMVVPAELPAVMEAFKIQQFRWTKGIAQTSRKTLRQILALPLPLGKKLHSIFHLLSSFLFLCLLLNALLTVPLLIWRNQYEEFVDLTNLTAISGINLLTLSFLYYQGTKGTHRKPSQFFINYPIFLVVYLGMSAQNAVAALQGLLGYSSAFVRTPKFSATGATKTNYLAKKISWTTFWELGLLTYFLAGIGLSFYLDDYFLLLFFCMISWGLMILIYQSLITVSWKSVLRQTLPKMAWR